MQILTIGDREKIEKYLSLKMKKRPIARLLKRDASVIRRAISKNTQNGRRYSAIKAQARTERESHKTNKRKLETDHILHDYVVERLKADLSPEEIAGRLKNHPSKELKEKYINHESIYQYIYEGEGRYEHLYPCLRKAHKKRWRKFGRRKQKTSIPERVPIDLRPEIINLRSRYGDWETDTMYFRKQKVSLSVQHERKSLLIRIHKVLDKSAEETEGAINDSVESLPAELWKSLTYDNDKEGVRHTKIRDGYDIETYFCDPYASWQKGGVENSNGLLRQYLPRTTDLSTITDEQIYQIQEKLNNRPRKKLNYLTPNEVISTAVTN